MSLVQLVKNRDFNKLFKKTAWEERYNIAEQLSAIFELPELHISKYCLSIYHCKHPQLTFNKELASDILKKHFEMGSFFCFDFTEPFYGGYPRESLRQIANCDSKIAYGTVEFDVMMVNWNSFVEDIESAYWAQNQNLSDYTQLLGIEFFEDRLPKTKIESFRYNFETEFEGKIIKGSDYKFFDESAVAVFYDKLIPICYPEYSFAKELSSKKVKRYKKRFNDTLNIVICVNLELAFKELSRTHLQFPKINVELIPTDFKGFVAEKEYVKNQERYPIIRFGFNYFLGAQSAVDSRIGNSSQDQMYLKQKLIFVIDVYSFFLKRYIYSLEQVLAKMEVELEG